MNLLKTKKKIGEHAEIAAKTYLLQQGLIYLESNYRSRMGEIDLIMQTSRGVLVFVEVRQRASRLYGGALQSVTRKKQEKLLRTASTYLMKYPNRGKQGVRFDVVALDGDPPHITWVQQAFEE